MKIFKIKNQPMKNILKLTKTFKQFCKIATRNCLPYSTMSNKQLPLHHLPNGTFTNPWDTWYNHTVADVIKFAFVITKQSFADVVDGIKNTHLLFLQRKNYPL